MEQFESTSRTQRAGIERGRKQVQSMSKAGSNLKYIFVTEKVRKKPNQQHVNHILSNLTNVIN